MLLFSGALNAPKIWKNPFLRKKSKKGAFKAALGRMTFLTSYSKRAAFFTYVTTLVRVDVT